MKNRRIELLAPAGDMTSFKGAVSAGADAVYLGGRLFNARTFAKNFDTEELTECIDLAHIAKRKVYLTVNTLFKETELSAQLYDFVAPYYEAGVDALIMQDSGAVSFVLKYFPGLPVHASTQMTVTTAREAAYLKQTGVSRAILARELSLNEIRSIHEKTDIELEVFVHGSLCYCYSGRCLMSSMIGGRSANRGACAGPCRLPYTYADKTGYYLSMKDLCAVSLIPELYDAGVCSLKIEGRMKDPAYVAGVVSVYRKYLDRFADLPAGQYEVDREDLEMLENLYTRSGSSEGCFRRRNGREMISFDSPGYRSNSEESFSAIREKYLDNPYKKNLNGELILKKGRSAIVKLWDSSDKEISVSAEGDTVQQARSSALSAERAGAIIRQTGNEPFSIGDLSVTMDDDCFMSVGQIKALRRRAAAEMKKMLTEPYRRTPVPGPDPSSEGFPGGVSGAQTPDPGVHVPEITACVSEEAQWDAVIPDEHVKRVYTEYPLVIGNDPAVFRRTADEAGKQWFIALPYIVREGEERVFDELIRDTAPYKPDGYLARTFFELLALREAKEQGIIPSGTMVIADHSLYSWNRMSAGFWKRLGAGLLTAPLELNRKELSVLDRSVMEMPVYGYQPVMVTAHCMKKNLGQCISDTGAVCWPVRVELTDRKHAEVIWEIHCPFCYNVVYNPVALDLGAEKDGLGGFSSFRFCFTKESPEEVRSAIRSFTEGKKGDPAHTSGHYKRGVG